MSSASTAPAAWCAACNAGLRRQRAECRQAGACALLSSPMGPLFVSALSSGRACPTPSSVCSRPVLGEDDIGYGSRRCRPRCAVHIRAAALQVVEVQREAAHSARKQHRRPDRGGRCPGASPYLRPGNHRRGAWPRGARRSRQPDAQGFSERLPACSRRQFDRLRQTLLRLPWLLDAPGEAGRL